MKLSIINELVYYLKKKKKIFYEILHNQSIKRLKVIIYVFNNELLL